MMLYDLIIIGSGPSGSSLAYNIKKLNSSLSILILDKEKFPRYKPCGGGVSPEVANYLDFDLTKAVDLICQDITMVANKTEYNTQEFPLWMVRREKFDEYLLNKAISLGVEAHNPEEVIKVEDLGGKVKITTNQAIYCAKVVVLAEGARGKLARKLGFKIPKTILAAMEYEHYTSELNNKLYIDFDYNSSGYAWNFPKSDGLSLGIGGFLKGQAKNISLPKKLTTYVQRFQVAQLNKKQLHGHPILLYSGKTKLVKNRVLLIGEIAGAVDPLTAEGIRPAIKSGFLAANTINQYFITNNLKALKHYNKVFHQKIGRDFKYARIFACFLNSNFKKVLPLISSSKAVNGFMSVFSGKSTYRAKINWSRIMKLLWLKLN